MTRSTQVRDRRWAGQLARAQGQAQLAVCAAKGARVRAAPGLTATAAGGAMQRKPARWRAMQIKMKARRRPRRAPGGAGTTYRRLRYRARATQIRTCRAYAQDLPTATAHLEGQGCAASNKKQD